MTRIYKLLLLLLAISVCGCQTSTKGDVEVIDLTKIDLTTMKLSDFTTGMDVVKLETSDSCLIGMVAKISFSKDQIYISDAISNTLHVFAKSGKFLKTLSRQGRGPGEYMAINSFVIDENKNTIDILDTQTKKIHIYDLSTFKFIKDIPFPITSIFAFEKKDGWYYLNTKGHSTMIGEIKTNSDIIAFDPTTGKLTPIFDRVLPDDVNQTFSLNGFATNHNKEIFFSKLWQNQFYQIDQTQAIPILAVNAGGFEVPDKIKNGTYEQQAEFMNSNMSDNRYFFFRLAYYNQGDAMILFTNGRNPLKLHYYIRLSDKEYLCTKFTNDYIEGNPEMSINNTLIIDNVLMSIVSAGEEHSTEMDAYIKSIGLSEGQNPTLLLYKIKEK